MSGRTYTSGPFGATAAGELCAEKSAEDSSPSAFSNSCGAGRAHSERQAPKMGRLGCQGAGGECRPGC